MEYPLLKNQLPSSIKKVWKKTSIITFVIASIIGLVSLGVFFYFENLTRFWQWLIGIYFAIVLIIFLLNFFLIPYRYNYFRYEMTEKEIIFQKGFIFRSITSVPFSRIQHIETEQGPLLRQEQLMELIIHTAATNHQIAGLSMKEAQQLRQSLLVKVEEVTEDDN